jgi:hypothetical protein
MQVKDTNNNSGQTLVVLLIFVTVAMMVSFAAATLTAYTITNSSNRENSVIAQDAAVSGMENAALRLLRDTTYAGETLTLPLGTATITVTGSGNKTITSVGVYGNFKWTIQATATDTNGILTINKWYDVF